MHADLASTMLTPLHAAGWCLVDFFKPADFLVIQGTRKKRGARLLGGVRLLGIIRYVVLFNLAATESDFNRKVQKMPITF